MGPTPATLTSSTTAGTPTITATDNTQGISGQATLTQTPGPAANIALSLNPTSIVANGTSTTTATATVTDANGNPVSGETLELFSGFDRPRADDRPGRWHVHGHGHEHDDGGEPDDHRDRRQHLGPGDADSDAGAGGKRCASLSPSSIVADGTRRLRLRRRR